MYNKTIEILTEELKKTIAEIQLNAKDNEIIEDKGYILCVTFLEIIKYYCDDAAKYGLDFDIEERYPL